MKNTILFSTIIKQGLSISAKNYLNIFLSFALWLLTIWVPYVNIGTTIALMALPLRLSKGERISPLDIFSKRHYASMGEFFLVSILMFIGVAFGFMMFVVPAVVLAMAWSLATLLVLDKGLSATQALSLSHRLTTGHKWTIFWVYLIFLAIHLAINYIIGFAFGAAMLSGEQTISPEVFGLIFIFILFIILLLITPFYIGLMSVIYRELTKQHFVTEIIEIEEK